MKPLVSAARRTERFVPAAIRNVLALVTGGGRGRAAEPPDAALLEALAGSVIDDLSRQLGTPCALNGFHATRTGSLIVRLSADRAYVAKLPLRASTDPRLRESARALQALGQHRWVTPFLAARWPSLVLTGAVSGSYYSVETAVPGRDGASILRSGGRADELILSAERFIVKLQNASFEVSDVGPGRWEAPFAAAVERVAQLAYRAGEAPAYGTLIAFIRTRLATQRLPSVYSHGNFWLGNVLFDTGNNLTGVIDWDCATEFGLPALDLIYFLVRTHSMTRGASYGEAFADWIDGGPLPFLDDCAVRHCRQLSLPASLVAPLSYCSWIQHLDAHCRFGTATSADARWLDRNVGHVLRRWRRRVPAGSVSADRWTASATV